MSQEREVIELINIVLEDGMIPKNVKSALKKAKEVLNDNSKDLNVRLSSAIYIIEKVTDEPNLMPHARTNIWNILSRLESLVKD